MILVIDTCGMYGDLTFGTPTSSLLLEQITAGRLRIVMPAPVTQEFKKHLVSQIENKQSAAIKQLNALVRLGVIPNLPYEEVDAAATADQIHQDLLARLVEHGVEFPAMPQPDHTELSARSVAERKPFGPESRGYRDTLIWLTALDYASEDSVMVLTTNTHDFAADPKSKEVLPELHQHLTEDLIAAGHAADRIALVQSIDRVVEDLVPLQDQLVIHIQERVDEEPEFAAEVLHAAEEVLRDARIELWDDVALTSADVSVSDPSVRGSDVRDVRIVTAFEMAQEDVALLTFFVEGWAEFEFLVEGDIEWVEYEEDISLSVGGGNFGYALTGPRPVRLVAQVPYNFKYGKLGAWMKSSISDAPDLGPNDVGLDDASAA